MIEYRPRGTQGFECELRTTSGLSMSLEMVDSQLSEPEGDVALLQNQALGASLTGYAVSQLAYRRARQPERKKSFEKQASVFEREATAIAEYISLPGGAWSAGWCSGCFAHTRHRRVLRTGQPVPVYLCRSCGAPTTPCAAPRCQHFARRGVRSLTTPRYCSEHRHEIPCFDSASDRLGQLDDAQAWMTFSKTNLARATKVAGVTVGVGAALLPVSIAAAPAIGGALGAWTGLSGAAATSHGLALLGGGSIAAGGLGMAGGTAVVAAAGTALGGIVGATTVTAYTKSDASFGIERLAEGDGPPVVIASGFLTEGQRGWGPWQDLVERAYPDSAVYRVSWGAKELRAFAEMFGLAGGKRLSAAAIQKLALKGMKTAGAKLGPLAAVFTAADLAKNPWTVARTRANMTGAVMADLLARTDGGPFVLVGHSLGARVMAEAALALGTKKGAPTVLDMHLLGAAIGSRKDWRYASEAVQGTIYNYYSQNDKVLGVLYRTAELGSEPAGLVGIATKAPNIKNRDVSRLVNGHGDYFHTVKLSASSVTSGR